MRKWLRKHQPDRTDHDDLESAVLVSLLEAERRFTGTPETWPAFAWPRIKGTIIDEIRKDRPCGFRRQGIESRPVVFSLDAPKNSNDESELTISDLVCDPKAAIDHDPVDEKRLSDAVLALSINQRMVVEMLVEQDWTTAELARTLQVTESAISLAKRKIRNQLLESLAHPMPRAKALRLLRSESFLRHRVRRGCSTREIAAELGVNRSSVRERMRMHGIKPVERPRESEEGKPGA